MTTTCDYRNITDERCKRIGCSECYPAAVDIFGPSDACDHCGVAIGPDSEAVENERGFFHASCADYTIVHQEVTK